MGGKADDPEPFAFPTKPSHQSEVKPLIEKATIENLKTWLTKLSSFHNRYYRSNYGTQSSQWLFETVKGVVDGKGNVTTFKHSFNQPSVIATIPGSSSGTIVIGAHQDSVGTSASGRAPGADGMFITISYFI